MCGIYCYLELLATINKLTDVYFEHLKYFLSCRGPDTNNSIDINLGNELIATFCSYVLHTMGCKLVSQPVIDEFGNVLLWNGNIFGGLEIPNTASDTLVLLNNLSTCHTYQQILDVFQKIQGPWSFIYWQKEHCKLWFGRDVFGRRSLLVHLPNKYHPIFFLTSATSKSKHFPLELQELPASGLYCLLLNTFDKNSIELQCYPWTIPNLINPSLPKIISSWKSFTGNCINDEHYFPNQMNDESFIRFKVKEHICLSLASFNSTILGSTNGNRHINNCDPTIKNCPKLKDNKSQNILSWEEFMSEELLSVSDGFLQVLQEAVRVRVQNQPPYCQDCIHKQTMPPQAGRNPLECLICSHSKVAILFSGGIDSLVLAALTDRFVPITEPIDLLNVAFEQIPKPQPERKKAQAIPKIENNKYEVPDRKTGLQGLKELQNMNPSRQWNFVEINITREELQQLRTDRIRDLVYPLQTVLDDSIGCAIWFAARGQGDLITLPCQHTYTSKARIVLTGIGADEQLAGYSRHRVKFESQGWLGLIEEIQMEIERISARNLGRDDRMIADHGKDGRFPFLDENVVSFLNQLPIWLKANLTFPRGIGEKLLLRLTAHRLGFQDSTRLAKRAIQFGSRIAKMENNKEHATDQCSRLS